MNLFSIIAVLEEQPNNLEVMMSLAAVYEEQGREEEALELVDFGRFSPSFAFRLYF